eukprot:TRINITY_DN33097_c1_g3_i6.p4 TRINITY_DN33097_c1_g3~~TRINITY_DN33097_c1_g3_i6.p4  ORF type:complete len:107 (-),score=9.70 TRINITY_DN33097_c1_g3_i6:27-347(-)
MLQNIFKSETELDEFIKSAEKLYPKIENLTSDYNTVKSENIQLKYENIQVNKALTFYKKNNKELMDLLLRFLDENRGKKTDIDLSEIEKILNEFSKNKHEDQSSLQ